MEYCLVCSSGSEPPYCLLSSPFTPSDLTMRVRMSQAGKSGIECRNVIDADLSAVRVSSSIQRSRNTVITPVSAFGLLMQAWHQSVPADPF